MSKILVPVLIGAALIGAAVLTGGASLVPTLTAGATETVAVAGGVELGVATLAVGTTLATTALGASLLVAGSLTVLSGISSALTTPNVSSAQLSRLNPSLITTTPRKIAFGPTALAADVRYIEPSGANQEYFDYIVAAASHAVNSIDAIWFDNQVAWTATGGVDPFYAGYLTVDIRTEGTATNGIAINSGAHWSTSCTLTGCAYVHFRVKRTGNSSSATSPLASGLSGRVTIIGTGAKVYDPRRDSTVGGSGPHRATDQTTWAYADGATILGNNPALQSLWYKLGWRINGKVAVGKGLPPSRIDLAAYIVAANLCDEAVTLAAGGTQRRYETAGVFSEADATLTVFDTICTASAGSLTDTNGKLGLEIAHNDLSGSLAAFDDNDILGDFTYEPCPSLHTTVNVVLGQWTDPSSASLYQLADVPQQSLPSADGVDRPASVQLGIVQDVNRAQRLFRQILERAQFQGTFTATFGIRALGVKRGQVITLSFAPLGFTAQLFRVMSQTIVVSSGQVAMVLREEDPAVYAWDAAETPVVVPSPPVIYDPSNDPTRGPTIATGTALPAVSRAGDYFIETTDGLNIPYVGDGGDVAYGGTVPTYGGDDAAWPIWLEVPHGDFTLLQPVVSGLDPITGRPTSGFAYADGSTPSRVVASGSARDGDIINFAPPLAAVPTIQFGPGGNAAPAGQNVHIIADGLTVSGFTLRARAQAVSASGAVVDAGATAGAAGEPTLVINRSSAGNPFDGRFTFRVAVAVGTLGRGTPSEPADPGSIEVTLFVRQAGAWTAVGTLSAASTGTYDVTITPGTVDFGSGAEFGVATADASGSGTALTSFTSVTYTPGTVTDLSLTPVGASPIPWVALL